MMESETPNAVQMPSILTRLIPTVGPLFLISVEYMDPGKWAAIIDGGSRFGFDFVVLVLVFNFTAILCQSLAAHIGVVTGKDLAQICSEEYPAPICISLGIQVELSVLILDLTMTSGIAHGLNMLLGFDLLTCILVAFVPGALILLYLDFQYPGEPRLATICTLAAGFVLLYYVVIIVGNPPEVPFVMNDFLPKVRGESLYAVMAFLGASILPHNFYLHSSLIQKQQRTPNISTGTLCYDHLFAIVIVFSLIFLVNYVIMGLAVSTFHGAGLAVLTFQDALLVLDQVLKNLMAAFVFFLVLLLASIIISLICTFYIPVSLRGLVGPKAPVHPLRIKVLALVPAIYSVYSYGAEGIYRLLVLSQIVLAFQLPSSVIPLFRVASSCTIMGSYKIPATVETLCFLALFVMLSINLLFVIEMLLGDSEWVSSLNISGSVTLPFVVLLVTACASVFLMLWLATTPLKSASEKADNDMLDGEIQGSIVGSSVDKEDWNLERTQSDGSAAPGTDQYSLEKSIRVFHTDKVVEHETFAQDAKDFNVAPVEVDDDQISSACSTDSIGVTRLSPVPAMAEIPIDGLSDTVATQGDNLELTPARTKETGIDIRGDLTEDGGEKTDWTAKISSGEVSGSSSLETTEGRESLKSITGKYDDIGGGSSSPSRLSGLGRAARRQLASILDEFWGQLYDFHGQTTVEAKAKRMDSVLGLRPHLASPGIDGRRSGIMSNSVDYDSFLQSRKLSTVGYPRDIQGSPSWSSSMQPFDSYMQGSSKTPAEVNERRYSSLHFPAYSESRDFQPATIHGYQLSSYLGRMGTDLLKTPVPGSSSFASNYSEPVGYGSTNNGFDSFRTGNLQKQTMLSMLPTDALDFEPISTSCEGVPSAYSKKYHSLPDISGVGISRWAQSSVERNSQRMGTIGPGQPVISQNRWKSESVPLAFDELSPSKLHIDAFSLQINSHRETDSLWARQPSEQLFGRDQCSGFHSGGMDSLVRSSSHEVSHVDFEVELLQAFRFCIVKLLRLEGSEWLFQQNGGLDEELIDLVAAREKFLQDVEGRELTYGVYTGERLYSASDQKFASGLREDDDQLAKMLVSSIPHCGDGCIWKLSLITSFGVWSIHRILDLALVESRPELWGKYTYVLNRLQGIIDLAFFHPRRVHCPCLCLQIPALSAKWPSSKLSTGPQLMTAKKLQGGCTSASTLLEIIKDVETAVASRKGRTGTAAGDVAFPKGKENLASVLKRYKRRLSNKSAGGQGGSSMSSKGIPSMGRSSFVS